MPSERDFAERLREQAYKTLSPQINDLEQELKEFSNSLSSGIYQIERKLEAISQIELPTTKVVLEEILQEALRQKDQEEKSLVLFTRDLSNKETQEEILGLLLDYAHKFFPRVALFTVRNDRFIGWSSRGYSEETARNIADFSLPGSECPQFQEALESEEFGTASNLSGNSSLSFLQVESAATSHLMPLQVMQRPVAILCTEGADDANSRSSVLSILTKLTELRLENIALKILYALTEEKTTAEPEPVIETEPAEEAAASPEIREKEQPQETVLDADEEKLHADAKRFARLLISEIKLYNETAVLDGRENSDLYLRLKRDIDKSREMYENRVSPAVSQKTDYFHDEIVRILGDNDPSTLGSDYPGPRVES